jgi:hypothetical protein
MKFNDSDGTVDMVPEVQLITSQRTGSRVDNWKKKIKSAEDATSSFSDDRVTLTVDEPGLLHYAEASIAYPPQYVYNLTGYHEVRSGPGYALRLRNFVTSPSSGPIAHDVLVDSAMRAQAKTRLLNKLRDQHQGADGLVFLGELRETIHGLLHPADAMRKYARDYIIPGLTSAKNDAKRRTKPRKSDGSGGLARRRRKAFFDAVSGQWLEFAYGLKPLISDCKDIAITALRMVEEQAFDRKGVKVLRSGSDPSFFRHPSYNGPGTWTTSGSNTIDRMTVWSKVSQASCMYRLGFKQDVLAPTGSLERLVELSGISLDRIVPTLWELTPYSFLADYFVNLGDILSAAVQSTVGVVWTNHTDRQLTISSWRGNWRVRTNYANPRWVNLGFKQISDFRELQHRTVTRYVDTVGSLNSIPLVFTIPGIDSTKWINMGALLWQHSGVRF